MESRLRGPEPERRNVKSRGQGPQTADSERDARRYPIGIEETARQPTDLDRPQLSVDRDFDGRPGAALVAGGTGGVGAEVCRALAQRGTDLAFSFSTRKEKAEATAGVVESFGRQAEARQVDLCDPDAARAFVESAVERFGGVHTFVHASGPFVPQAYISTVSPGQYRRQLEHEAVSFFNVVHAVLPHLRESHGPIVAVTSVAIRRFPTRDGLSPSTKGAIEGLVRVLAHEEGRFGVRANCVGPGILRDGMTASMIESGEFSAEAVSKVSAAIPLRRLGSASEVAEVVCFLASPRASYVTGQTLDVDGGYSI